MQQEQRWPFGERVGFPDRRGYDVHGDSRDDRMRVRSDVETDVRVGVRGCPDTRHRITRGLVLVGMMIRRIVLSFVRVRDHGADGQVTDVAEQRQEGQDEDDG